MEITNCPLCSNVSNEIAIIENSYKGYKCKNCDLIFISPKPSIKEILEFYDLKYSMTHLGFEKIQTLIAKLTLSTIKKYITTGSILEIGSGAGGFLLEAKKNGYKPYSIEVNPFECKIINQKYNIPCENKQLNPFSFGNKKFDIIYHRNVLSHFYDPIETFSIIYSKLNKNGIVVFETGNIGEINRHFYKIIASFEYPTHLFFYSKKSIKKLLNMSGFEILKINEYTVIFSFLFGKILNKFRSIVKNDHLYKHQITEMKNKSKDITKEIKKTKKLQIRILYRYISYFLTYKIGSLLKINYIPKTLIVMAKRTEKKIF